MEQNTTTIYTVRMDGRYPYALVLAPGSTKPEKYEGYYNQREVQENMRDNFGADVKQISRAAFQAELEKRQVHTEEMIALLWRNGDLLGQYLCGHFVYGSFNRPMDSVTFRIEGAVYIQSDKYQTGFHTYVAVLATLNRDDIIKIYHDVVEDGKHCVRLVTREIGIGIDESTGVATSASIQHDFEHGTASANAILAWLAPQTEDLLAQLAYQS